jgi:hypothetical protein
MTDAQRAKFFGTWWPACCEAQGWDPKSEKHRRSLVHEATKGATDRLSLCTQAQLTAVFELTWHKTKPDSLDEAIPVANPELAAEQDEQRRCVFALLKKGIMRPEIERIAAPLCRRHRVGNWELLPSKVLKEMMRWKQFSPTKVKPEPASNKPPIGDIDEPHIYHLRPAPPATVAGPF